jgi:5,10-methylene-tetrahydrofolate dehydrogenase/methenyl tetrahydrofolate cyclohydrolase
MPRPIAYRGLDGTMVEFPIPKHVNRHMVARAVKAIHLGHDADLAVRGLTPGEYALLLNIIAELENHRIPAEA